MFDKNMFYAKCLISTQIDFTTIVNWFGSRRWLQFFHYE